MTDPRAAHTLTDPARFRFFEPFLGRSRTVGEAAAILECKPNSLLAQVRRMLACGLLIVVREVPRAGRAVKVYRSSAEAYFIPRAVLTEQSPARWWADVLRKLVVGAEYSRIHSPGLRGVRVYLDAHGVPTNTTATDADTDYDPLTPDEPATVTTSHDALYLDFADAKAFQHELYALLERYRGRGGGQRYLAWLNLVPLPPDFDPTERYEALLEGSPVASRQSPGNTGL